jgi:hypothetical protein
MEFAAAFLREVWFVAWELSTRLYFLPAIVALARPSLGRPQRVAIVVLNLGLGWFVLAWFAVLGWAIFGSTRDVIAPESSGLR